MATSVIMPELGESVIEGTIGRWLVKVGDTIREYDPLVEIETDKVTTEIPAPASGTVLKILAQEGEVVKVGMIVAVIGQPDEQSDSERPVSVTVPTAAPQPDSAAPSLAASPSMAASRGAGNGDHPRISPVVARIAAEHQVDPGVIPGTGRNGRVTRNDILAYIEHGTPQVAPISAPVTHVIQAPADHTHMAPPPVGQPGELVQLSSMRRRIAEHMVMSKLQTAPHVTTVFEADLGAITSHREQHKESFAARGVNLTFTAYFVAATAHALRAHPMVNSRWTDEGIYLYQDINIGMAVAIDEGLIVPVIRQADELSLQGLARQVNDLANRARSNQLKPDEIQGGTFTITNHGVSGSLFATPIINQPQTGILGVGAIQKRVVVTSDDAIAIRPMAYIGLTFDHRVLDGATADWFVAELKQILETWSD